MKKILSILMAMAMLFAFAAVPSFAEGEEVTVDLTTGNIGMGATVTSIAGKGFYSGSVADMFDGDLSTGATARANKTDANGYAMLVDFGKLYNVDTIDVYVASSHSGRQPSIYVGAANERSASTLIQKDIPGVVKTVNGVEVAVFSVDVSALKGENYAAQYVIVHYPSQYDWGLKEVVIKGDPEVTVDFASTSNIALNASESYLSGTFWGSGNPSDTNKKITDGDLTTYHSGTGQNFGDNFGVNLYLDKAYDITKVQVYSMSNKSLKLYEGAVSLSGTAIVDVSGNAAVPVATASAPTTMSNINGTEIYVTTFSLPENFDCVQRLSVVGDGWSQNIYEVYIEGVPYTKTQDILTNNIIKGKTVKRINYRWGKDASVQPITDGDLTTEGSMQGNTSPSLTTVGVDLDGYHKINKITIFIDPSRSLRDNYQIYSVDSLPASQSAVETWNNPVLVATISRSSFKKITVNDVDLTYVTVDVDAIVSDIIVNNPGSSMMYINEVVIDGVALDGIEEVGKTYSYSANNVTASVELFNASNTATATGVVYFAAYNADEALVGFGKADVASIAVGASAEIAPAAFEVTEEPAYVKAFYWVDGTFVPVLLPTNVK